MEKSNVPIITGICSVHVPISVCWHVACALMGVVESLVIVIRHTNRHLSLLLLLYERNGGSTIRTNRL